LVEYYRIPSQYMANLERTNIVELSYDEVTLVVSNILPASGLVVSIMLTFLKLV
jgi:hypothetical protein